MSKTRLIVDLFRFHRRLEEIERTQEQIMAGLTELQAAIDTAVSPTGPGSIAEAVVTAVKPLIGTGTTEDTQPAIDRINAMPQTVAAAVTAALTPPPA